MCGFTGFIGRGSVGGEQALRNALGGMQQSLSHRGPDDSGDWIDPDVPCALGFRRLAIIDLSPAGHQPMISRSGRYVIAFNGEVYNFERLRAELPADTPYRGHSDTEVILAAIERWGLEEAVRRFIGMFAFALWDREERRLHLVRDRIGVKPLYYGWSKGVFLFGSELKALRRHPDFDGSISRQAVTALMRYNYIPSPHSIYENFHKLMPGTILSVRAEDLRAPSEQTYWSAADVAQAGLEDPLRVSAEEAADQLDALLRDAVGLRMVADVPLGVFLSGGVDSSTVVAIMQAQSSRPVRSFAIGYHENSYNEAPHARAVAEHLGTDHTELYVTSSDALAVIPQLPRIYDEPFADSSQIPTFLVSQLARRQVTVSLSGDGGDELFAGYNRYAFVNQMWSRLRLVPRPLRVAAARAIIGISPPRWDSLSRLLAPVIPVLSRQRINGDRLHKFGGVLGSRSSDELYRKLVSQWDSPTDLVLNGQEPPERQPHDGISEFILRMMFTDLVSYLPDDIMAKVDRASMAVSLEAREPLLDHRLVEFSWRLPLEMKLRGGVGKWLLRQVLYRYVPQTLIDRPKMGFSVPIDAWLRGPLRPWAEELLDERQLQQQGFFHTERVRSAWQQHLSGTRNWQYHLWGILMFQAWLKETQSLPVSDEALVTA